MKTGREMEAELVKLRKQARVWAKQRAILMHNLASVLNTAKAEISRKDATIGT